MQCDGIQGGGLFMVLYLLLKAEVRHEASELEWDGEGTLEL